MGVWIDEAGRHDQAASVDGFGGVFRDPADLGDSTVCQREVRVKARRPGAVDDRATFNDDVISHDLASLPPESSKLAPLANRMVRPAGQVPLSSCDRTTRVTGQPTRAVATVGHESAVG